MHGFFIWILIRREPEKSQIECRWQLQVQPPYSAPCLAARFPFSTLVDDRSIFGAMYLENSDILAFWETVPAKQRRDCQTSRQTLRSGQTGQLGRIGSNLGEILPASMHHYNSRQAVFGRTSQEIWDHHLSVMRPLRPASRHHASLVSQVWPAGQHECADLSSN